jgi:hypothetical protein
MRIVLPGRKFPPIISLNFVWFDVRVFGICVFCVVLFFFFLYTIMPTGLKTPANTAAVTGNSRLEVATVDVGFAFKVICFSIELFDVLVSLLICDTIALIL